MANKNKFLGNTNALFGPLQIADRYSNGRALIIGRNVSYLELGDLTQYFDLILIEDVSYSSNLIKADICFWQMGSPYVSGIWAFPESSDLLMLVNLMALKKIASSSMSKQTYNLAYLPSQETGNKRTPDSVKGLSIGLNELNPAEHLAKISGCIDVYDSENRAGTLPGSPEAIAAKIATKNSLGMSTFFKAKRFTLLEQL